MTEAVSTFLRMIKIDEDFETGAKYLSSFFRRTEERWDAGDVLEGVFSGKIDAKILEYTLFCFLHVGRSDIDTAAGVLPMRRLNILLLRAIRFPHALCEQEYAILARLRAEAGLRDMQHFYHMRDSARTLTNMLLARQPVPPQHCTILALLMECEANALTQRLNYVSDRIDPYDLKAMAKILPLVTIYEERARAYKLLAAAIRAGEEIGKAIISFEYFMKEDDFKKWLKLIGKKEGLRRFYDTLLLQREKKIPTRALVGISSIARCVLDSGVRKTAPLNWISRALESSGGSKFSVNCGDMATDMRRLLSGTTVQLRGAAAEGDYTQEAFASLTGADMLTVTLPRVEPDPSDLIRRAIANDAILLRLLDNPKIYGKPGLVEYAAKASRSLAVLTKIASRRELYTGAANTGVPAALLRSPCAIPISLLRGFINTRYIPAADLREIAKYSHTVRREVHSEVENYMKRR